MSGKTATSTSSQTIPQDVLARYNSVNSQAETVAQTPYTPYSSDPNAFVAPLNSTQQSGIANTTNAAGEAQPFYGLASAMTQAGAGAVDPGQLNTNQYLSPYLGTVLGSTVAVENQQNAQQASQLQGNAISQGAFGGDRSGVALANLAQQQGLANNQTNSQILNQGYNTALSTAQQQQGVALSAGQADQARLLAAGQQQANLGAGAQQSALQGAAAEMSAGQTAQQTQQAGLSALYNQFLQQQSYPFQTAQFLANIAEGTGALSGSTTSTTQPTPFFSDERLKEDIEPIGKLFDGTNVVKFRYKGDKQKHVGFIAQDVEKRHPEAVGLARGYKTVDYDAASKEAAERGHFYAGGRTARAYGGDSGVYEQGTGTPYGGKGVVPSANVPIRMLPPVQGPQKAPQSMLGQMVSAGQDISAIGGLIPKGQQALSWASDQANNLMGKADGGPVDPDNLDLEPDTETQKKLMNQGSVTPVGAQPATGLAIPNQSPTTRLQNSPNSQTTLGTQRSVMGDITDAAKTAMELAAFFARGGRAGYAGGGPPTDDNSDPNAPTFIPDDNSENSVPDAGGLAPAKAPRSVRNNNPGNIEDSKFAQSMDGYSGSDGRFAIFNSPESGAQAMDHLLNSYGQKGLNTPAAIINRWSPSAENGSATGNYIHTVASQLGVGPNDQIDMSDPKQRAALAQAMAGVEAGTNSANLPSKNAHNADFNSASPVANENSGLGGIGNWFQQNQNWIVPVLKGLGTMASSQSLYPGAAILQGLGGGAQAYSDQQLRNAEIAKNTFGIMQQRFTPIVDNSGNTKYLDKATNSYATPQQVQQTLASVWSQTPGSPFNPAASSAAAPGASAPAVDLAKTVTVHPQIGTQQSSQQIQQPSVQPQQADEGYMDPNAVRQKLLQPSPANDYISNPQLANFANPRYDSDMAQKLQPQIDQQEQAYNVLNSQRGYADPNTMAALNSLNTLRNTQNTWFEKSQTALNAAAAPMDQRIKTVTDQFTARRVASADFLNQQAPVQGQLLDDLGKIYTNNDPDAGSQAWSKIIGHLHSLNIPSLNEVLDKPGFTNYKTAVDAAHKDTLMQALASSKQVPGAPASTLNVAMETVANPEMSAGARYNVVRNQKAQLLYQAQNARDFLNTQYKDPTNFDAEWTKDPNHQINAYKKQATATTPIFKGMTPQDIQQYVNEGVAPATRPPAVGASATSATPVAHPASNPAIPTALRSANNLEYNAARGLFRDRTTGAMYDTSGKRVQ